MPNSDPRQIITPLVLVGLGLGVGEGLGLGVGEGLGLGNQVAISTRGVIIWLGLKMGTTPAYAWFYKSENFCAYAKLSFCAYVHF